MLAAARAAPIDRYPDPTASELRQAIARQHEVPPDAIVVGNGAADLLWTLARALCRPRDAVLIVEPTFAEFRSAATAVGAEVIEWRASPARDFAVDLAEIERLLARAGARVLYLCTPGSPSGSHVPVPARRRAGQPAAAGHRRARPGLRHPQRAPPPRPASRSRPTSCGCAR